MGRHFGIGNRTQKMNVSEGNRCWTGYKFCDCHEVMHRYHWQITDVITSAAYDSFYVFKHNEDNNQMDTIEADFRDYFDYDDDDDNNDSGKEKDIGVSLGFDGDDKNTIEDHAPIWDNNECVVCGYKFDPINIKNDMEKFSGTYFMN